MAKSYIHIPLPTVIYVLVNDRAEFDMIARPATDHGAKPSGHCFTKVVEQDGVEVIFQHWEEATPSTAPS